MKDITIQTKEGASFVLSIPAPASIDSFFVFSLHKAGSTLLNKVINDCCTYRKIPFINFPSNSFTRGFTLAEVEHSFVTHFEPQGYCYGGFRLVTPAFKKFDFASVKKIYLIRDPRDILVSFYYSVLKSHTIPKEGTVSENMNKERKRIENLDINNYVLEQAPGVLNGMRNIQLLGQENIRLYRYEDIIFRKKEWIKDMLSFLDLDLEDTQIDKIVSKHDIRPDKEDQSKHIRQVTPGDHKEKLNKNTIEKLNIIFQEPLLKYGYL